MKEKRTRKSPKRDETKELIAHLQKLQAEFENYRKRTEKQKAHLVDLAKENLLEELLPALDNYDRATSHLPKELEKNSWAVGMQSVGKQLIDILGKMGVKKFSSLGQKFDPHRDEAVEYVESDKPEGTVIEEVVNGYELNGRIIRPAIVKVSKHNIN
ncbi:MAG: nucleotide exchange factor GrpE [bacterium]|nr:nucleotide exchange factor GrpE [bacterium]